MVFSSPVFTRAWKKIASEEEGKPLSPRVTPKSSPRLTPKLTPKLFSSRLDRKEKQEVVRRPFNPLDWSLDEVQEYLGELQVLTKDHLDTLKMNSVNGEGLLTIAVNQAVVLEFMQIQLPEQTATVLAQKLAKFLDKVQRRTNPVLLERKMESVHEHIEEMKTNLRQQKEQEQEANIDCRRQSMNLTEVQSPENGTTQFTNLLIAVFKSIL